jgi:N-acetylglucosamine-6-phosphate deacetylase
VADALVLRGGTALSPTGWRPECDVHVAGSRVVALGKDLRAPGAEAIDARGHLVAPGFIDVHLHGACGAMFEEGRVEGVEHIGAQLSRFGTTAIAATLAALDPDRLRAAVRAIAGAPRREGGARILGIHLEGPFLNPRRAGAQAAAWMRDPSVEEIDALQAVSSGMIRLVTVAPELPGALEFIAAMRARRIAVALGHSEASDEQVGAAVAAGAQHVTHLFNAAAPFHHRAPGLVGSALTDDRLSVELIADGVHLHQRAIDIALRCKPPEKVVLVSDGVAAVGMPDGAVLDLFGLPCVAGAAVRVRATGQLAGSRLTLDRALRRLRGWFPAVPLERLLAAVSAAPAALLGAGDRVGAIAPGQDADLVVLTPALEVAVAIGAGRVVHRG